MTRLRVTLVFALAVVQAVDASSQGARGVPRIAIPEVPQQEREQPDKPLFRAAVTRVEVSVLVLDRDGTPVRGLTAADFEVFEEGVPQVVRSFAPFTYEPDLLVLPEPVLERDDPSAPPASGPASNYYTSASRVFALILDDLHVDVRRTQVARAAARRLVEQLTPLDLLLVTTTSSSESTGYFTRDRRHALQMIEQFMGQRLLDKTIGGQRFPGHDFEAERLDHYQRLCAMIRDVSSALRDVSGRRKTVILVSEGSSFGAGMSDMTVRMPTATSGGRANVPAGSSRVMNEALAAAAAGNVAIYPLNPAGLDVADADLIQVSGLISAPLTPELYSNILIEARQAKEMARDFATLTGGVSLVDTNDAPGGIDRAVRDASSHYVLTYEPEKPPKGTEYRSIEVKVRRPGVRVLARRGYSAPGVRPMPPMKVPGTLSPQLRTLLAGVMPGDGLPMRVQAVPVSRTGKTTMLAVVVEVNGTLLGGERRERTLRLEQGLLTVNATGNAANGVRRIFDVSLSPVQWEILSATGLRSVWAIELPTGRHQVRVASVDVGTGRGGSVYLEVDVAGGTAPPGALVASRFLSSMPTVFADQRLARWTTVMPTATRVFPEGDVLTITVPHSAAPRAAARLSNAAGQIVWEGSGTPLDNASAVQFVVPLERVGSPVCDLTIETSHGLVRTTIGIVSPGAAQWDWPQWRGPSGHGVSSETGLPTTWSTSANVAWRAAVAGLGTSSPIVTGDRVIVTSQIGHSPVAAGGPHPQLARDDRTLAERENPIGGRHAGPGQAADDVWLVVEAFSRSDGRRMWEYRSKAIGPVPEVHEKHNLATPTPVTDGERVYAWFGNGQIVALDLEGRLVWTRHLGVEIAPVRTLWGHGSSPVVFKDLLILLCDHLSDAYLLAVDARTGQNRWKVDRGEGRTSHSTPLVVPGPDGAELLVNSSERIDVYDPGTGRFLWFTGEQRQTPIPSAVFHDGRIFLSRGYRNSDYMAVRPGGRGDVTKTHVEWRAPSGASYVPSIVHYQGLLYMTNEVGVVTCADAQTGEPVWRHRLDGVFFASPVAGDGKIYLLSETGETFVLRAGRKPEVLARNDLGQRFIASPAISHGRLFLRSDTTLFAIGQ
jgi:VWFA-related protein